MYQCNNVHANAIQNNGPSFWQNYRELRNRVTGVMKERLKAYLNDMNVICRNDPKRMWSEIKRLVPDKNKHSHITYDTSAYDFNQHFANTGNKMNSKLQNLSDDLFWKGSKSIHTSRFTNVSNRDFEKYLSSQPKYGCCITEKVGPINFWIISTCHKLIPRVGDVRARLEKC